MLKDIVKAGLPVGEFSHAILTHPHAFFTGMQGPDLFLFYPPAAIGRKKLSSLLHTKKIPTLLGELFDTADGIKDDFPLLPHHPPFSLAGAVPIYSNTNPYRKDDHSIDGRLCALAYACGFLGHYLLDSHTHAFIYARTGVEPSARSFAVHNALESDLSRLTVERSLEIPLACLPRPSAYHLSPVERRALSLLLSQTICRVYSIHLSPASVGRAFHAVHLATGILYDPHGCKARIAKIIERPFCAPYLSPLFLGESRYYPDPANLRHQKWSDPYTGKVSHDSFFELYDRALMRYLPLLRRLESLSNGSQRRMVFEKLCRRDFHGEPIQ